MIITKSVKNKITISILKITTWNNKCPRPRTTYHEIDIAHNENHICNHLYEINTKTRNTQFLPVSHMLKYNSNAERDIEKFPSLWNNHGGASKTTASAYIAFSPLLIYTHDSSFDINWTWRSKWYKVKQWTLDIKERDLLFQKWEQYNGHYLQIVPNHVVKEHKNSNGKNG